MENFTIGRTVIRYIRTLQAFHFGIIAKVNTENILNSKIIDFDMDDEVNLYTLKDFLYNETIFWIATWENEPKRVLKSIRDPSEIVKHAIKLLILREKNSSEFPIYSIVDNNCEHFVRKCTFSHPDGHKSRQIERISGDSRLSLFRIGLLLMANSIGNKKLIKPDDDFVFEPTDAIKIHIKDLI